eukprot:m.176030 g.176030  ORF g.176030 m.176030 type:complete len:593 (+) comp31841_c1_seq1:93-1871(+)
MMRSRWGLRILIVKGAFLLLTLVLILILIQQQYLIVDRNSRQGDTRTLSHSGLHIPHDVQAGAATNSGNVQNLLMYSEALIPNPRFRRSQINHACAVFNGSTPLSCFQLLNHRYASVSEADRVVRPLRVRFKWYTEPERVYVGYGGRTAAELLKPFGFVEVTDNDWDLLWTMMPQHEYIWNSKDPWRPSRWQKQNHCLSLPRGHGIAGGKKSQWTAYVGMRKRWRNDFNYMPESFNLPSDWNLFQQARLNNTHGLWMVKPARGARGKGLVVTNNIERPLSALVQRYVANPLLMRGKKFHLRIYVVISNVDPLRVLTFNEGLLLTASKNFTTDPRFYTDLQVHLSNSAMSNDTQHKTSLRLSDFWLWLGAQSEAPTQAVVWQRVSDVVGKLVMSSQIKDDGHASESFRRVMLTGRQHRSGTCFDLFGADIMFTDEFEPVLLELNNGPEVYTWDRVAKPINHLVHTRLLQELIPLVAMPRSLIAERVAKFESLVSKFFQSSMFQSSKLVSRVPIMRCNATNINDEIKDKPRCVSSSDIIFLWQSYDEGQDLGNFQRIYPTTSRKRNAYFSQFYIEDKPWRAQLLEHWLELFGTT